MVKSLTPSVLPPQTVQKKVQLMRQLRRVSRKDQWVADPPSIPFRKGVQIHDQKIDPGKDIHWTIVLQEPLRAKAESVQNRIKLIHHPFRTGMKGDPD
jgi:hypothetical protein